MSYQHGIDCVEKADPILCGKRIGLITNYTGLNSRFQRTVDILHQRYGLTKLFAPEHGLDGVMQAGVDIEDLVDAATGLPVLSMFKADMTMDLEGLDLLAYDIQDIGLRFFTHISVLSLAMKECARNNLPMVVFDRYNPLGLNVVKGTLLDAKYASFVGMHAIPSRYGLTVGEFARYINEEECIHCQLHVIACEDLKRSDNFKTLSVNWVNPSPNCPTFDSALTYSGTVLFEGTNVSEGRGTTKPFEFIGAPWIHERELADAMNAKQLPGVWFRPIRFMPVFSKYKDEVCCGVQLHILDYATFDPFYCALTLFQTIRTLYPEFKISDFLVYLTGTEEYNVQDFDVDTFVRNHRQKIQDFQQRSQKYWLYV